MTTKKPERPRNIANDILDVVETATSKWTKQKKSEERHPGMVRYRVSRMTKEPRTTQKDAAWEILEEAYMAASGGGRLPALARQVFYQARPKIMKLTEDKELAYGYFSQTLLPDYIEEHGVNWNVVYDARGHFEEPHTNRRIGCGTIEVDNYLQATKEPEIVPAEFSDANVSVIGPSGEAYQAFQHSQQLREIFERAKSEYEEVDVDVPEDLKERIHAILHEHDDLRWDDAIHIVLDETQLDHVRGKKQEAREKSGEFRDEDEGEE